MTQHSTPALDDQFPLHPQEIRSAALQAAARITTWTQYKTDDAGALALDLAARFESYIEYGSLTQDGDATEKPADQWVNPGVFIGSFTITPEKIEAGRKKLLAAIRGQECPCPECVRARKMLDEFDADVKRATFTEAIPPQETPAYTPIAEDIARRISLVNSGTANSAGTWVTEAKAAVDVVHERIAALSPLKPYIDGEQVEVYTRQDILSLLGGES